MEPGGHIVPPVLPWQGSRIASPRQGLDTQLTVSPAGIEVTPVVPGLGLDWKISL